MIDAVAAITASVRVGFFTVTAPWSTAAGVAPRVGGEGGGDEERPGLGGGEGEEREEGEAVFGEWGAERGEEG
jgi:hypothetical protein